MLDAGCWILDTGCWMLDRGGLKCVPLVFMLAGWVVYAAGEMTTYPNILSVG